MDTKEKFQEMVAYDFGNLNLQQESNVNCFTGCEQLADCYESACDEDTHCDCDNDDE
jgi:hypothetical protein